MTLLWVLVVPLAWLYMNFEYGQIHGRRLRWPYFWAAHGALMFGFRCRRWEQR